MDLKIINNMLNQNKTYTEGFKEGVSTLAYGLVKGNVLPEAVIKVLLVTLEKGNTFQQEEFMGLVEHYEKFAKEMEFGQEILNDLKKK